SVWQVPRAVYDTERAGIASSWRPHYCHRRMVSICSRYRLRVGNNRCSMELRPLLMSIQLKMLPLVYNILISVCLRPSLPRRRSYMIVHVCSPPEADIRLTLQQVGFIPKPGSCTGSKPSSLFDDLVRKAIQRDSVRNYVCRTN